MNFPTLMATAALIGLIPAITFAEGSTAPLPATIFDTEITGMPTSAQQEIRVLTAEVAPGQMTIHHTHPFPVTTYVLTGEMTFQFDGQDPVTVSAGQAFVEPAGIPVTGQNNSTETTQVVIFYVSASNSKFISHLE